MRHWKQESGSIPTTPLKKGKEKIMENRGSSGIGFGGLLTIALIVLKLTNVISLNWVWVLSPLWMPLVIFILLVTIAFF